MKGYFKSVAWLTRAEQTIPLGSQTFSKSRTQYPVGISPLYATKAKGCKIWDIDGNRYVDLVSGLACITLGYGNSSISRAIKKQLGNAISMSLPGKLEAQVAEQLVHMIPSAEMVRFGKNGTDATSGAIRLARAYTGRDHILVSGYHGWQDWFIGSTTRNKGVPRAVSELTHSFKYNDIQGFQRLVSAFDGQIAAVIMEPMNSVFPEENFLQEIRRITHQRGIVLIFDETITGFRFSNGGAQEYFNVIPDLSTFGKGMANGMPISAIVGRRDLMMEMEEIFFSGTFGGELLSLTAANEVLQTYQRTNVTKKLYEIGDTLGREVKGLISDFNLQQNLILSGHPSWMFLNWKESEAASIQQLKTFFMQEVFKNGVLVLATHNINTAFKRRDLNTVVNAYSEALRSISEALQQGNIEDKLKVRPIENLFQIRS